MDRQTCDDYNMSHCQLVVRKNRQTCDDYNMSHCQLVVRKNRKYHFSYIKSS